MLKRQKIGGREKKGSPLNYNFQVLGELIDDLVGQYTHLQVGDRSQVIYHYDNFVSLD